MTTSEKYNLLKHACDEKKVCAIQYVDNRSPEVIHPLGICITYKRGLVIVCCPANSDDLNQWNAMLTNVPIEECDHVKILDERFQVTHDFLKSSTMCVDWLFHVNNEPVTGD
jgi:hypothetical protein